MAAGPIEFSGPEIAILFALFFLGPPLVIATLGSFVHVMFRARYGEHGNGRGLFFRWLLFSFVGWVLFVALRANI